MSDEQDSDLALTPEEQVKEARLDPAYRDNGNWRHAEAVQRVHDLAKVAWPDPPASTSTTPASSGSPNGEPL